MFDNPGHKRDQDRKVRFTKALDRKLRRDAAKAGIQHATLLYLIIVKGIQDGVLDELIEELQRENNAA